MAFSAGTRLDHYDVTALLGEGDGSANTGCRKAGKERCVMCGPRVIGAVKQEITRRQPLGLLATPAVAGTLVRRAAARQAPVRLAGGFTRIHDLTHTLSPQTPVFPAFNSFQIVQRFEAPRPFHGRRGKSVIMKTRWWGY